MLSYTGHETSGVLVFTVEESAEGDPVSLQREWLYKSIESHDNARFAIDLGAVKYMASSDIGLLITLKRRIDSKKGQLAIFNVDPFIYEVLRTMRIEKLFTIVADFHAATLALGA